MLVFRIYSTHVDKPGGKEHRWCPSYWLKKSNLINMKRPVAKYFFHHQKASIFSDRYLVLLILLIINISDIFTFKSAFSLRRSQCLDTKNHFPNHGDAALIFIYDLWFCTANKETNLMNTKASRAIQFARVSKIFSFKLSYRVEERSLTWEYRNFMVAAMNLPW